MSQTNQLKFHISTTICQQLIEGSRPHNRLKNARYLSGNYFTEFRTPINNKENKSTDFVVTNAVVYPTKKKSLTSFLKITAYCKQCKKIDSNNGRYDIEIKESPFNNHEPSKDQEFALVCVTIPTHNHIAQSNSSQTNHIDDESNESSPSQNANDDNSASDLKSIHTNTVDVDSIPSQTKSDEWDDLNSRWDHIKPDQLRGDERDRVCPFNILIILARSCKSWL
jgi:hypothetical protein